MFLKKSFLIPSDPHQTIFIYQIHVQVVPEKREKKMSNVIQLNSFSKHVQLYV